MVTSDEVGDPNAPTDEWTEGRIGRGEEGGGENKTMAKAK